MSMQSEEDYGVHATALHATALGCMRQPSWLFGILKG